MHPGTAPRFFTDRRTGRCSSRAIYPPLGTLSTCRPMLSTCSSLSSYCWECFTPSLDTSSTTSYMTLQVSDPRSLSYRKCFVDYSHISLTFLLNQTGCLGSSQRKWRWTTAWPRISLWQTGAQKPPPNWRLWPGQRRTRWWTGTSWRLRSSGSSIQSGSRARRAHVWCLERRRNVHYHNCMKLKR